MADYRCPWCGYDCFAPDEFYLNNGNFTHKCRSCDNRFRVDFHFEAEFEVETPQPLLRCFRDCDMFGIDDSCNYYMFESDAPDWCPRGFGKEGR